MSKKEELEIMEGGEAPQRDIVPAAAQPSAGTRIAMSRAAQEVQAAMLVARNFPRDEGKAWASIMRECKRESLADAATYSFPRGDKTVTGPSIRLAEVLARYWGNIESGVIELEQRDGESLVMTYAWDLETGTKDTKIFSVPHLREVGRGANKRLVPLSDPRDVYEVVANMAARRKRANILAIIPGDVSDQACEECERTLANRDGKEPLIDRVRKMVAAFNDFGVTQAHIEGRLGHKIEATSEGELSGMRKIYRSINDGMAGREQYFDIVKQERPPPPPTKDQGVAAATAEKKPEAPPPAEEPKKTKRATPPPKTEQKTEAPPPETAAAPEAPEPPKEEKKAEPAKPPKTQLAPGENFECVVTAEDISTLMISGRASVKLDLVGEYQGVAYHVDGARVDPVSNAMAVNPVWQMEKPVRVTLRANKQKNDTVVVFVMHAELAT